MSADPRRFVVMTFELSSTTVISAEVSEAARELSENGRLEVEIVSTSSYRAAPYDDGRKGMVYPDAMLVVVFERFDIDALIPDDETEH